MVSVIGGVACTVCVQFSSLVIWTSKNGSRLYTKRKAAFREADIPESLFRYILMCRCAISKNDYMRETKDAGYYADWLNAKTEAQRVGHDIERKISSMVYKRCGDIDTENKRLVERMELYDALVQTLKNLGLYPETIYYESSLSNRIDDLKRLIPAKLDRELDAVLASLTGFRKSIAEVGDNPNV